MLYLAGVIILLLATSIGMVVHLRRHWDSDAGVALFRIFLASAALAASVPAFGLALWINITVGWAHEFDRAAEDVLKVALERFLPSGADLGTLLLAMIIGSGVTAIGAFIAYLRTLEPFDKESARAVFPF